MPFELCELTHILESGGIVSGYSMYLSKLLIGQRDENRTEY